MAALTLWQLLENSFSLVGSAHPTVVTDSGWKLVASLSRNLLESSPEQLETRPLSESADQSCTDGAGVISAIVGQHHHRLLTRQIHRFHPNAPSG